MGNSNKNSSGFAIW